MKPEGNPVNMKWSIEDKLLYGCDYNPDQWLNRPDILAADIELMRKAHISVVSLGIFAWSSIEVAEGQFQFEWLDKIMDDLHEAGIPVFLATPSGARPTWMARKYPEVLRVNPSGNRNLFGLRHNHCYSSPVYREKVQIINTKLAKRYSDHPAVILWHISNEYSGDCHCDLCQVNFRTWLQKRYRTLENLNDSWWNTFWSHTIFDWEEIHSPVPHGETSVHGLNIDWKRFTTHMTVDFMKEEVDALKRAGSTLPVTTNMMMAIEEAENDPGLDYWKFKDSQDYASWDSYPAWHLPGHKVFIPGEVSDEAVDDYRRASEVAFQHDIFRNLHKKPFLLMESTPSKVNWQGISKNKKPGMNILSSLQAVAHGANSVQYFQWRQGRGSFEKFHGAVVDQSGTSDTRIYREAVRLGEILEVLKPVAAKDYSPRAALIFNWENRWAFDDSMGPINNSRKAYIETLRKHYFCLWDFGLPMDVVSGEEELMDYDLVIAPMLYSLDSKTAENLKNYVHRGGTILTSYLSGYVNETDLCFEGGSPGPLQYLLGIQIEDLDSLHKYERIHLRMGEDYPVQDYYEVIHPLTAQVLASFTGKNVEGLPGLTVNNYGKGMAFHLAGRLETESLKALYQTILSYRGIHSFKLELLECSEGINLQIRSGDNEEYLFVMNFCDTPGFLRLSKDYTDCLDYTETVSSQWDVKAYGIRVLKPC
jgi:beta-galactosidase